MNKQLKEYCVNKALTIENNSAYGFISNYEINITLNNFDTAAPLKVLLSCFISDEQKDVITRQLNALEIKNLQFSFLPFGIFISLNAITFKKLIDAMDKVVTILIDTLIANGVKDSTYCPICGEELTDDNKYIANFDFAKITIDNNCKDNINANINKENDEFNSLPNNYLKGTLGALLGAGIGAISYIIIFMFNFISAISAFISIYLGILFYKKFGGKPNKMMILIVTLITIVVLLLTVVLIYVYAANNLASQYGYTSTGFTAFADMLNVDEFRKELTYNLAMTAVFTLIGSGFEVFSQMQKVKRQQSI